MFDGKLRLYRRPRRDFYSDLFPLLALSELHRARQRAQHVHEPGHRLGATYDIIKGGWKFIDKGTLNIVYDHMLFDYQNFRDLRVTGVTPGTEPLYNFDADVLQVFVSFWF